ncbi:hypothetical protein LTR37_008986 [Vermiconidia calcicola]|uniref:Uncharacterized protein n=1 Tax=Vermiconidia calcicola TaxID=1690605 RepID=A0ACC3N960_9PEZI|nr:hypothetical protein LTR37_008986 [Vermiconidia calcicola]
MSADLQEAELLDLNQSEEKGSTMPSSSKGTEVPPDARHDQKNESSTMYQAESTPAESSAQASRSTTKADSSPKKSKPDSRAHTTHQTKRRTSKSPAHVKHASSESELEETELAKSAYLAHPKGKSASPNKSQRSPYDDTSTGYAMRLDDLLKPLAAALMDCSGAGESAAIAASLVLQPLKERSREDYARIQCVHATLSTAEKRASDAANRLQGLRHDVEDLL